MIEVLSGLASRLWQPWIAIVVLFVGLALTVVTRFVQLGGLRPALRRSGWSGEDGRARWGMLAVGCGAGGLGAGALAVQWGGRGAIVWMWIAMLLAMAWRFGEGVLQSPASVDAKVGAAKTLTTAWHAAGWLAALSTAGLFGGHQLAALLGETWHLPPLQASIGFAIVAAAVVAIPAARRVTLLVVPLALLAWVAIGVIAMLQDDLVLSLALGDAWSEAFGLRATAAGAATGGMSFALAEGMLAASLATGLGQGAVAKPDRASMLAPLVGVGLVASLGALVAATTPAPAALASGDPVPLERHHSRGLRPSQQVGQTVVMPADTPLVDGETYAFLVRGNPRGIGFARLDTASNSVLLPAWGVTEGASEVVFRMRDKDPLARNSSWDVRIPCTREVIPGRNGGPGTLRLVPVNPELELKKLIAYYELSSTPYVPLDDYSFVGKVGTAQSPDEELGKHLAMFEFEAADRVFNPKLHEFFRGGYRGPYADIEHERPPWAWIAPEGFDMAVGTVVDLRLVASPRGESFIRLNRTGGAEAPPWDFLMKSRELVVQHESDPDRDIVIPVDVKLDGYRIRYVARDPEWSDFRKIATMPGYKPTPFVRVHDFDFVAEIHSDARLAPEFAGRRAIVPQHTLAEPQGPYGEYLPYAPHPMEVVGAGMLGPVVAREGAGRIAGRFVDGATPWSADVVAIAMIVLGIGGIVGWASSLGSTLGRSPAVHGVVIAIAAAFGGAVPWLAAQSAAAITIAIGIALGALLLVTNLGRIGHAAKHGD